MSFRTSFLRRKYKIFNRYFLQLIKAALTQVYQYRYFKLSLLSPTVIINLLSYLTFLLISSQSL